jgi:hypothetical protein
MFNRSGFTDRPLSRLDAPQGLARTVGGCNGAAFILLTSSRLTGPPMRIELWIGLVAAMLLLAFAVHRHIQSRK